MSHGTYAFLLTFPLGSVTTDRAAVVYNAGDGAVFLLTSVYEFYYEHILKIDIEIDIVLNYKNRIENRSFTKNLESSQHYYYPTAMFHQVSGIIKGRGHVPQCPVVGDASAIPLSLLLLTCQSTYRLGLLYLLTS